MTVAKRGRGPRTHNCCNPFLSGHGTGLLFMDKETKLSFRDTARCHFESSKSIDLHALQAGRVRPSARVPARGYRPLYIPPSLVRILHTVHFPFPSFLLASETSGTRSQPSPSVSADITAWISVESWTEKRPCGFRSGVTSTRCA